MTLGLKALSLAYQISPRARDNSSYIYSRSPSTEFNTKMHANSFRPQEGSYFVQHWRYNCINKDVFLKILRKTGLRLQVVPQKVLLRDKQQLFKTSGAVLTDWTDSIVLQLDH